MKTVRQGLTVFSLVFSALFGGISVTVLLANDGRHFRSLMDFWQEADKPTTNKHGNQKVAAKGKRLFRAIPKLASFMLRDDLDVPRNSYLRDRNLNGEELCEFYSQRGIKMTIVERSGTPQMTSECTNERQMPGDHAVSDPSSFFFIIRWGQNKELLSARVKIVIRNHKAESQLVALTHRVMMYFCDATSAVQVRKRGPDILQLHTFASNSDDFIAIFFREYSSPTSFNLILSYSSLTDLQRPTAAYFDRAKFFRLWMTKGKPIFHNLPM